MEGSFDNDVLIGDGRANSMLGQPGDDRFYGNGGEDMIDARDGVRDELDPVRPRQSAEAGQAGSAAGRPAAPSPTPSTPPRSSAREVTSTATRYRACIL